jgi:hypothetical protein
LGNNKHNRVHGICNGDFGCFNNLHTFYNHKKLINMKKILLFILFFVSLQSFAQIVNNGAGTFVWTNGAPSHNPSTSGAKFAVDRNTFKWYEWISGTSWTESGERVQFISGCAAPAYTPTIHQSKIVVNACTTPEMYIWSGSAWGLVGGLTWPLLAPDGEEPTYSFGSSPSTGVFFDGSLKIKADAGVALDIFGADNTGADGGGINIQSGGGDNGGAISMNSGAGDSRGGDFALNAGTSSAGNGGGFSMAAGSGVFGGGFAMSAGNANASGEPAGGFGANAGDNPAEEGYGGTFYMRGGNAEGAFGVGGNLILQGGNGGVGGGAGNVVLFGGTTPDGGKGIVQIVGGGIDMVGMTTAQRNALVLSPSNYRIIFNTTTNKFQGYANGTWVDFH